MRRSVKILLAVAAFDAADLGLAGAQSAQCNAYPQSPGCPGYVPGQGYERNPRIGPTYLGEAGGYYRGGYDYDQTQRSSRGRAYRQNDLNYLGSLGSQTPRSVRHLC